MSEVCGDVTKLSAFDRRDPGPVHWDLHCLLHFFGRFVEIRQVEFKFRRLQSKSLVGSGFHGLVDVTEGLWRRDLRRDVDRIVSLQGRHDALRDHGTFWRRIRIRFVI